MFHIEGQLFGFDRARLVIVAVMLLVADKIRIGHEVVNHVDDERLHARAALARIDQLEYDVKYGLALECRANRMLLHVDVDVNVDARAVLVLAEVAHAHHEERIVARPRAPHAEQLEHIAHAFQRLRRHFDRLRPNECGEHVKVFALAEIQMVVGFEKLRNRNSNKISPHPTFLLII